QVEIDGEQLRAAERYLSFFRRGVTIRYDFERDALEDRLLVASSDSVIGYGDGTDFVIALPVPTIEDVSLESAYIGDHEVLLTIKSQFINRTRDFSLQIGDYVAESLNVDRRYRSNTSRASTINRLQSGPDAPFLLNSSDPEFGVQLSALSRTNAVFPTGPIRLEADFGWHDFFRSSDPAGNEWITSLVAETGTPADPNRPSINPGQRYGSAPNEPVILTVPVSSDESGLTLSRHVENSVFSRASGNVASGLWRTGFFGMDQFVQVVPTIDVVQQSELWLRISGCVPGDMIEIGESVIVLEPSDFADDFAFRATLNLADPRISSLSLLDWSNGFVAVSAGGRSETVYVPRVVSVQAVEPEGVDHGSGWLVTEEVRLDVIGIFPKGPAAFISPANPAGSFEPIPLVAITTPQEIDHPDGTDIASFRLPIGIESGRLYQLYVYNQVDGDAFLHTRIRLSPDLPRFALR
ncbi:MAG: hypothetical protein AAF745_17180, partial [Planctomycetota bacterium]